jgi:hypothetical protein
MGHRNTERAVGGRSDTAGRDARMSRLDRLAWKFHYHRVPHVGGCHEFPNGGRGPNCRGPSDEDYLAAREVLADG